MLDQETFHLILQFLTLMDVWLNFLSHVLGNKHACAEKELHKNCFSLLISAGKLWEWEVKQK